MLAWRDIVLYGLSKEYPRDIVSQIVYFLHRENISHICEESRIYHINRLDALAWSPDLTKLNFAITRCLDEFTNKWDTIDPKGKEYTYMDCWRWDRFSYPYMEFVYAFNRGRIFLRFLKGYEWYDLDDENNIVDKLTDYEEIK
jgi:hypothetical protein